MSEDWEYTLRKRQEARNEILIRGTSQLDPEGLAQVIADLTIRLEAAEEVIHKLRNLGGAK